jgi:signal transduction histidine kinase
MNLVLNAIQAMPDGGTLRIACARVPGPVAGTEWAEIDFADTGPGIPEEHREKVFRPLFTTRVLGSGLGLAIARRVL